MINCGIIRYHVLGAVVALTAFVVCGCRTLPEENSVEVRKNRGIWTREKAFETLGALLECKQLKIEDVTEPVLCFDPPEGVFITFSGCGKGMSVYAESGYVSGRGLIKAGVYPSGIDEEILWKKGTVPVGSELESILIALAAKVADSASESVERHNARKLQALLKDRHYQCDWLLFMYGYPHFGTGYGGRYNNLGESNTIVEVIERIKERFDLPVEFSSEVLNDPQAMEHWRNTEVDFVWQGDPRALLFWIARCGQTYLEDHDGRLILSRFSENSSGLDQNLVAALDLDRKHIEKPVEIWLSQNVPARLEEKLKQYEDGRSGISGQFLLELLADEREWSFIVAPEVSEIGTLRENVSLGSKMSSNTMGDFLDIVLNQLGLTYRAEWGAVYIFKADQGGGDTQSSN